MALLSCVAFVALYRQEILQKRRVIVQVGSSLEVYFQVWVSSLQRDR
jgi:hypothetical protein